MICWRCLSKLVINSDTGNCLFCGFSQDINHEIEVMEKKLNHDRRCSQLKYDTHGIQSWGGDSDYPKIRENAEES